MSSYKSREKKRMELMVFTLTFGSRDPAGKVIIKMIINTIRQVRDKKSKCNIRPARI